MAQPLEVPELQCMEPDNYRKFFRALCWSGIRAQKRNGKKDKKGRGNVGALAAACHAPALLGNPSHFAVYANIRKSILSRWRHLQLAPDLSSDSDNEDGSEYLPLSKLPKITGIGLCAVFALIAQARNTDSLFCELALSAMLDVLQGHPPEELCQEPSEVMQNLHSMLVEVAAGGAPGGRSETPTTLTALSSSCLVALSVGRGEADFILSAVASLIMSPATLSEQTIQIPFNLTTLQRSVQSVVLGPQARNQWLNFGVPSQALVSTFTVNYPTPVGPAELVVRSLVSDGCFIYIYSSKGLTKIGSGYGDSIRQHLYLHKPDFFPGERHGWLGYCKGKLYARIGKKKKEEDRKRMTEIHEIDVNTFEVIRVLKLEIVPSVSVETKTALFSDGNQLGLITQLGNFESLLIRMYDVANVTEDDDGGLTLTPNRDLRVHLLRKRTLCLGRAPFDDGAPRRDIDLESPIAMQFDDNDDDPLSSVLAGQDFALLTTMSGKVYYTGKGTSLGYKASTPHPGRWTLMKETLFNRNESPPGKKCRIQMMAVGHEGVHAVFVLDNGTALFTGVARRGEDGDAGKHRRTPKPTRPKKIAKADSHHIVYAACNHGSTALVTRLGVLLMFGKDTQHCDASGVVTGLRNERVIQVALGKAHAVALTHMGQVYTFGINNKGQCGREFGYTKEKPHLAIRRTHAHREEARICGADQHKFGEDQCRVCTLCLKCTGWVCCQNNSYINRVPGDKCGCGEGTTGCSVCGICKICAQLRNKYSPLSEAEAAAIKSDAKDDKENIKYEAQAATAELEREASLKLSSLPPGRVAIPGGHRVVAIASGLHHTVMLTEHGEVLTFGSNQWGQLGAGDISVHHRIVRVRMPRAMSVAAGSNHTAVVTREGELYTFGSYQKGSLGRPCPEAVTDRPEVPARGPIWYATPGRVPRVGPRHSCRATWVACSGEQTFFQVSQALIKTETLFSSTITANHNCITILPKQADHAFKCITINKQDGLCNTWTGAEQVDFVGAAACLDPLYDVLWCYQPQMRLMKCFNILAFDPHRLQRCSNNDPDVYDIEAELDYPNYGSMKRLEDFKNLENVEFSVNEAEVMSDEDSADIRNISILDQELAIPVASGCSVTRIHAALHLLGCLDSLTFAYDTRFNPVECKRDQESSPIPPIKEDFLTVNRFESHGGGWGYSGHSVEAIRFMCDNDIMLGGIGLFGGRGDYTAKIKLYDIGPDGGDQEGDGDLVAESEEVVFECAPRDKYPVMFEAPVQLFAHRWYVAWACLNGPSSDCGSSGQAMVINDDIGFHFKTSKKSNNGTDVNAGQIPCLLYNVCSPDQATPVRLPEPDDPIIVLSRNVSRKVTVPCFRSLITLLEWSWNTFKQDVLEANGQKPVDFEKLTLMKKQKRLVYVIKACLRLLRSYINEIYPQDVKKRNSHEYMPYIEAIADVKNIVQGIMADPTPTCAMIPRKPGKHKTSRVCYVLFSVEMTRAILKESHETITACYHAFFPTATLKWNHICSLLRNVQDGVVPATQIRELTSSCAALCASKSLREVLHHMVPVTQSSLSAHENRSRPESRVIKEVPASKSATVPRSANSQKPPPIPPRASSKDSQKNPDPSDERSNNAEWHLLDIIPKLMDIVMIPIKQKMMSRKVPRSHDHGELKQNDQLTEFCCKFAARIVAELSYSASNIGDEQDINTVKHLVTPSRFMRVNQSRAWNTGNGSPDAICFTVDRPGTMLVGVCIYGGMGNYEYSMELLLDDRQVRTGGDEIISSNCWVSVEITNGVFTAADCQHDMVQLKFEKPIPLKEDHRYAIRLCNHGGRTANGDCGLPSVKGPDDTTFRFASCSLSFNGTTLARGQIPCLIYFSSSKSLTNDPAESTDTLINNLRSITLRVASIIMERAADMFSTLRSDLTVDDMRRNAHVLQKSPVINTLLPFTLANLEGLNDSKSVIILIELIHKLLPQVAAINLMNPNMDDNMSSLAAQYYAWAESEHPYKHAMVTSMRVLFPTSVSWIVLEMDPRSITSQPEDTLTIYAVAGTPKHRCHCSNDVRVLDPPYRKVYKRIIQLTSDTGEDYEDLGEDGDAEAPCMHYNCSYIGISPKLANIQSEWPQKALLIPGNEVVFSLETASDYLSQCNKAPRNEDHHYGFRCLCVGFEDSSFTAPRQGIMALETELVYAGAAWAAKLLAPDIDIPSLSFTTLMEVQVMAMMGATNPSAVEGDASQDGSETLLLSRGLQLSSPPTIHHVLDGLPLLRCVSTERQFLSDFVSGSGHTAGGRLARWLSPTPCVEPAKCELMPQSLVGKPQVKMIIPVLVRDQYGDIVTSKALRVEMVIQKLDDTGSRHSLSSILDLTRSSIPDVAYKPTLRDSMNFHAITMMKAYQLYSFEELRLASGMWGGARHGASSLSSSGRAPAERLVVPAQGDGSYLAAWTPAAPGTYLFRCTFDDVPAPQEYTIEVVDEIPEPPLATCPKPEPSAPPTATPSNQRRFDVQDSAGLRVRGSPSLQAEELGRIAPGCVVEFVEELINKDGTWLRLSEESIREYTDGCTSVAWTMQHHRHLDKAFLVPMEPSSPPPQTGVTRVWSGFGGSQGNMPSWTRDEDDFSGQDSKKDFGNEGGSESDSSISPFFSLEPSKRARSLRNEAAANASPKRSQQKSNGNAEECSSPNRQGNSDNDKDPNAVQETDTDPETEQRSNSGLAQTGTQTSPDSVGEEIVAVAQAVAYNVGPSSSKLSLEDENQSPQRQLRERMFVKPRPFKRGLIGATPPCKLALSPCQAECLRAIFAALLWHEGIVHDAIACATFLKFHPQLPKQGAPVVTRSPHDVAPHAQRHSVEVTNAGQYLRINPSTLETLTRSGAEATASRKRKATEIEITIHEDGASASTSTDRSPSVVNVLPPALRALVAVWDALVEADELASATNNGKDLLSEQNDNGDPNETPKNKEMPRSPAPSSPVFRGGYPRCNSPQHRHHARSSCNAFAARRAAAAAAAAQGSPANKPAHGLPPPSVVSLRQPEEEIHCELCGGMEVEPPLAGHMRENHPGCHEPAYQGYDRHGSYKPTNSANILAANSVNTSCGQLAQAYQLYYVYCEKCRDRAIKSSVGRKSRLLTEFFDLRNDRPATHDHHSMKDNAVFLLDLAPLTNTEPRSATPWRENSSERSPGPPTPAGSLWQPAPAFQCLRALCPGPKIDPSAATRYYSLGRPYSASPSCEESSDEQSGGAQAAPPRVHRSVSMGQAGGSRDLAAAAAPPLNDSNDEDTQETLSGVVFSSLLSQPSAALQKLIKRREFDGEPYSLSAFESPYVDPAMLMNSPVLAFVLSTRDLHAYRQKMDAAIRINTVRQYAFEALNWLLRSTTQPTGVHDVMWWYCNALDKFARIVPPPLVLDDAKELSGNEFGRASLPTASAAAICPGGRSARGARTAFHAFLGSVSALAPFLPPASATSLQAVRCWALHYSPHDRNFLHRSQVFNVISKILSPSDDGYDDAMEHMNESVHSYLARENYVWSCPDVTGWCDITVSSRQGMAGALTDGTTETFWESGDEDRNKAKWIQVSYPGGTHADRPHVICVHIDNTRDTGNKTLLISFLFSGGSTEMFHMQDIEVDTKAAVWLCYTLPRLTTSALRVRCELRGPEPSVRVRQVKVLSAPASHPRLTSPALILRELSDTDTLRVFRLLTCQVFGKLLEWDNSSEPKGEGATAAAADVADGAAGGDDSDLREHVVGILFAGHKLTSLQKQVMSHIVHAIGSEAARVREDWEIALKSPPTEVEEGEPTPPPSTDFIPDNYCFEMLSLLLALSGSAIGRAHLAQRTEILVDLLSLLHTGTARIQRQVISLLRRMICEVSPQKMLAAINYSIDSDERLTLLDYMLAYIAKALTLQVKKKGSSGVAQHTLTMGSCELESPPAAWFMRGKTTQKHAHLVAKLLSDMLEDKVTPTWGLEIRSGLAKYVAAAAQVPEEERQPEHCVDSHVLWLALAALCVYKEQHMELINGVGEGRGRDSGENNGRPFCANHDDGTTGAVIDCRSCGPLCAECDRFLHLNRNTRHHQRQICKEEESAIRIDIHEGCGRAKLFWLLLLVDQRTLKALAEFRGMESAVADMAMGRASASSGLEGVCRFCGARGNTGLLAIGNVCSDPQCQEFGNEVCIRVLGCGHLCGGVRAERTCLPCLFGCATTGLLGDRAPPLRQDADDMCMICFTDPLQAAPAIQLKCGHVFHMHCCLKVLANKWNGPRITFTFSLCPICKEDMVHWTLDDILAPIRELRDEVRRKALMRLEYEGVAPPGVGAGGSSAAAHHDPAFYAMERYAYYVCHKCGKAYFGGLARCEAETSSHWEPAELVCGACSDVAGARVCPKHGSDFLEYKCRYCCSVAVFFCFGTSHFCNACHDDFQRVTNMPRHMLPRCPAGPKCEQLPGTFEECPLHVQHPPTGEEFALGCGVCRHANAF